MMCILLIAQKCNRNESSNRNNMKLRLHLIILIIPLTLAISQEVTGDSPTGTVVEIYEDNSAVKEGIPDTLALHPEIMGLDYGYKGYIWGSPKGTIPQMPYMNSYELNIDSSSVIFSGNLGPDEVTMEYVFGDSGLWKVEISYVVDPNDLDRQIHDFHRVANVITEIYGPPVSSQQTESGPGLSNNNEPTIHYSRAFFMSSWVEVPSRIELILHSLIQLNMPDFPIINDKTSLLRLVYYNPDYMLQTNDDEYPSIFDLY